MDLIARHPYYKVERILSGGQQVITEEERWLLLYRNGLHTKHRQFSLQDVYDISCRMADCCNGMLYLHTKQGVFMYMIKTEANMFIEAYKQATQSQDCNG